MTNHRSKHEVEDDALTDQVAHLKSDLTTLKSDVGGIARALASQGRASAGAVYDDMERRVNDVADQGRTYVKQRPLTAAAGAFGVGLLAGFLMSRR
ncbi:MAG: DUF883 family protein [Planctomycetes bacterium]|nr:DUF883 family protein [Planctomycetota bacterium]